MINEIAVYSFDFRDLVTCEAAGVAIGVELCHGEWCSFGYLAAFGLPGDRPSMIGDPAFRRHASRAAAVRYAENQAIQGWR